MKLRTLDLFCENPRPHFLSGANFEVLFTRIEIMMDVEVFHFNVISLFETGGITLLGKGKG